MTPCILQHKRELSLKIQNAERSLGGPGLGCDEKVEVPEKDSHMFEDETKVFHISEEHDSDEDDEVKKEKEESYLNSTNNFDSYCLTSYWISSQRNYCYWNLNKQDFVSITYQLLGIRLRGRGIGSVFCESAPPPL